MRIVGALGVALAGFDRRRHCVRTDRYALTVRRKDCRRCRRQEKSARAGYQTAYQMRAGKER